MIAEKPGAVITRSGYPDKIVEGGKPRKGSGQTLAGGPDGGLGAVADSPFIENVHNGIGTGFPPALDPVRIDETPLYHQIFLLDFLVCLKFGHSAVETHVPVVDDIGATDYL
jgi:hypothetical protein